MRPLQVGSNKVLISKYQDKIYASGNNCSHYGAPLHTGSLFDNKVVCPWHAAAFNIQTGMIEQGPGSDGIPVFEIKEKFGKQYVLVPRSFVRTATARLAKRDPSDKRSFVIIGGGPASISCAETLR